MSRSKLIDLVIIRGLPGSGKTTLAHKLIKASTGTLYHAEADSFFTSIEWTTDREYVPVYNFDRRLLGAAHDYCYGSAMRNLFEGTPVIVSNTFTTRREIDRYVEGCKRSGLRIRIHVTKCMDEFDNVHDVPASAIERMRQRWEDYPGEIEYRQ